MVLPRDSQKRIERTASRSRLLRSLRGWHVLASLYSARILLVVQPNERNVFDQRLLEYQLFESLGTCFIRIYPHCAETSLQSRDSSFPSDVHATGNDCLNLSFPCTSRCPHLAPTQPTPCRNLGRVLPCWIRARRLRVPRRLRNARSLREFSRRAVPKLRLAACGREESARSAYSPRRA
jgi:hypothetical protein